MDSILAGTIFLLVSTMKLQLLAKKCVPKYQSPEPHLLSDEGIIPELFKDYDMLLNELNEVLPVTAHHTWIFHGRCTGMSSRES